MECGNDLQKCKVGYYYHERPTRDNDVIISVMSSMMLSQRETKQENLRNDRIVFIQNNPKNYVLLEVKMIIVANYLKQKKLVNKYIV